MRALLDVNILIALLDSNHVHHQRAIAWFLTHAEYGWASCPLTQNGCLRILSQPNYSNATALSVAEQRLRDFTDHPIHQFWPDSVSILNSTTVTLGNGCGPKSLTDIYLLALAVSNKGRLVTLDQRINLSTVVGATEDHLVVL